MNDKQIGLMIGGLITSIITIPTIYIAGRKSYKMGVKDGLEINQKVSDWEDEVRDILKTEE